MKHEAEIRMREQNGTSYAHHPNRKMQQSETPLGESKCLLLGYEDAVWLCCFCQSIPVGGMLCCVRYMEWVDGYNWKVGLARILIAEFFSNVKTTRMTAWVDIFAVL